MAQEESGPPAPPAPRPLIAIDLAWPLRVVCGAMFALIVALTVLQVGFRYLIGHPLIWSEELARVLLVWMVFLGAAALCWDGRHLDVDVVYSALPPSARTALRWINLALALAFLVALTLWSWDVVLLESLADMSALGIDRGWLRLPATVGGALMILFLALRRASGGWRGAPDDGRAAL